MEFCEGGTLEKYVRDKCDEIPWSKKWQWAIEICRGISYLHQSGILHRDLKSENILLTKNLAAKIGDLGVAQADAFLSENEAKVVQKGLQDQRFISPEKLKQKIILLKKGMSESEGNLIPDTPAMDIYALGLVFWEMLTGKNPRHYSEMSKTDLENWIKNAPGFEREKIPENCPSQWKQIITMCLDFDPTKRPTSQLLVSETIPKLASEHLSGDLLEEFRFFHSVHVLEDIVNPHKFSILEYIPPFVTKDIVEEPLDEYWAKIENATSSSSSSSSSNSTPSPSLNFSNPPFILQEQILSFLRGKENVLVLLGESGLGKSLTTFNLAEILSEQWRSYFCDKKSNPKPDFFPVFLRPSVQKWKQSALTGGFESLKKFHGIEKLEEFPLLVIVDAYDELAIDEKRKVKKFFSSSASPPLLALPAPSPRVSVPLLFWLPLPPTFSSFFVTHSSPSFYSHFLTTFFFFFRTLLKFLEFLSKLLQI
jgi:serine/threonine protein kinase